MCPGVCEVCSCCGYRTDCKTAKNHEYLTFVISSSALRSVLQTTGKVVSSKNTLPILDYFLLELKGGMLKVTASDLETTLVGTLAVENVEKEGIIAAPVKLMLDLLKEFSEQPLTI